MSAPRVVLVSPYALSVYGGVQEQVLAMSRVLSARGREVLVVAPDANDVESHDTPARVVRLGVKLPVPANGSKAPLTLSPLAARRASEAIDAFRPSVVHFHEPFAPLVAWAALRAHRHAALATFHRGGGGPALRYTGVLLRRLATGLDVGVSVSDAAAKTIRDATGLVTDVLFNGFEVERFVSTPRERSRDVLIFCVGRLEERKGVAYAIQAVREHNARADVPWRFVIAGDGPERRRLEALAANDERIIFLGRISDESKRAWLRRVDVLVAPATHGESFGLVLLEAMASETLVVASDIEGYREAAGGHAALFRPASVSSLEETLVRVLANESERAIAAARSYVERWSMASLMDDYEDRYDIAMERFRLRK